MTREQTAEYLIRMLPVMVAYLRGATVEVQRLDGEWVETTGPGFQHWNSYRVKPEPAGAETCVQWNGTNL